MNQEIFADARILIVDDEPEKLQLLTELLTMYGYRHLLGVLEGDQVMDHFHQHQPDLVILDLRMPGYSGFQVLNDLVAVIPSNEYLPIIVQTGDTSREAKEQALMAGAKDFVAKPFNTAEILLRVRNLLHTRALHLQLRAERESLERRVIERTRELAHTQNEMLERLAMAAEFRDDETGEHIRRVGTLSSEIALEMGLPQTEAELIGKAALLHDIGKIGIRDDVLLKKGRFTPEEFAEMKQHTEVGGKLLGGSECPLLQKAESIARFHHEKWNGEGYNGLREEQIPLESRIVAVADVFDALISERSYKEAWSVEDAVGEIISLAGTHFDPAVVQAFRSVMMRNLMPQAA